LYIILYFLLERKTQMYLPYSRCACSLTIDLSMLNLASPSWLVHAPFPKIVPIRLPGDE
jgi:hypothetical protein